MKVGFEVVNAIKIVKIRKVWWGFGLSLLYIRLGQELANYMKKKNQFYCAINVWSGVEETLDHTS